jgi:hypothetical protein
MSRDVEAEYVAGILIELPNAFSQRTSTEEETKD